MNTRVVLLAACLLTAYTAASECAAAAPTAVAKPSASASAKPFSAIPLALAQKLTAPPARSAMLAALLGNTKTKSLVLDGTKKMGVPESQVSSLSTTPISSVVPRTAAATSLPASAAADIEYQNLDWASGLTFTPISVPTYLGGRYHVGDFSISRAEVHTSAPGVVGFEYWQNVGSIRAFVLQLELPAEPGLYMIAVKLTTKEGTCPPDLAGAAAAGSTSVFRLGVSCFTAGGTYLNAPLHVTRLTDGSGYVGVVSLDPRGVYGHVLPPTMRKATAVLTCSCATDRVADYGYRSFLFGGVTITRL